MLPAASCCDRCTHVRTSRRVSKSAAARLASCWLRWWLPCWLLISQPIILLARRVLLYTLCTLWMNPTWDGKGHDEGRIILAAAGSHACACSMFHASALECECSQEFNVESTENVQEIHCLSFNGRGDQFSFGKSPHSIRSGSSVAGTKTNEAF